MSKCKVIAIAHEKGGVGKMTTAVNLGIGLARQGRKVLPCDADPQGNLSKCLSIANRSDLTYTLATAMDGVLAQIDFDPRSAIMRHHEGGDFIPANAGLAATEITLVNAMNREYVLQELLGALKDDYDYILLDCHPSLGLAVINAFTAADSIIIPVQAHTLTTEDMDGWFKTIGRIKQRPNPALKVDGIVMTMVDSRTNLARQTIRDVRERYGRVVHVFSTEIPYAVRVAVSDKGRSIFSYDPNRKVAKAYERLTKKVVGIGQHEKKARDTVAR